MRMSRWVVTVLVAFVALFWIGNDSQIQAEDRSDEPVNVLVFTKTAAFRHGVIPTAQRVMRELGEQHGFNVVVTEDSSIFNDADLGEFDVVAFVITTGTVLSPDQKDAFQRFIWSGGGYVGVHSASDTEYDWPFYGELVGAYFSAHPPGMQVARVIVEDRSHPSTSHLDESFTINDEWYFFRSNPRGKVHVLQRLDRTSHPAVASFHGNDPHGDHPVTWCRLYQGGRAWYTALGHERNTWEDERFQLMLVGGLMWAAGQAEGYCGAP